jgi:hypothetical protein
MAAALLVTPVDPAGVDAAVLAEAFAHSPPGRVLRRHGLPSTILRI